MNASPPTNFIFCINRHPHHQFFLFYLSQPSHRSPFGRSPCRSPFAAAVLLIKNPLPPKSSLKPSFLVLNASQLIFDHGFVYFTTPFSKEYRPTNVNLEEEDEIIVFGFNEVLPIGEGSLHNSFKGTLNDQMKGSYRSISEYNGEKNMVVTQFEPADARRCFPCWDEPVTKLNVKSVGAVIIIGTKAPRRYTGAVFFEEVDENHIGSIILGNKEELLAETKESHYTQTFAGKKIEIEFTIILEEEELQIGDVYYELDPETGILVVYILL